MKRFIARQAFAVCAIAGLVAATAPARAEDTQTSSLMLRVSVHDLQTPTGRDALRRRVLQAARNVCGPREVFGTPAYQGYDRCVQQAEQGALARVDVLIATATSARRAA